MFIVKITATATETNPSFKGDVQIWYIGKGGYVYDRPDYCPAWSRKHFAEKWIKQDREWDEQYNRKHDQHFWDNEYEIIEI